jgi:four helix bundle protein
LQPARWRVHFAASRRHAGCIDPFFFSIQLLAAPRKALTMESNAAAIGGAGVMLDAERLEVYRVAREFDVFAQRILPRRGCASLRDQLQPASSSTVLNIAEGCGRYARPEKAHFYVIARGSAMECVAVLDVAIGRGLVTSGRAPPRPWAPDPRGPDADQAGSANAGVMS